MTKNPQLRTKALAILRLSKILGKDLSTNQVEILLGCEVPDRLIDYVLFRDDADLVVADWDNCLWDNYLDDAWELDSLESDLRC
jgi:hypothetical protein